MPTRFSGRLLLWWAKVVEKIKLAAIPEAPTVSRILLRKKPIVFLNRTKIANMLAEYGFFDRSRNPRGSFKNLFVDFQEGILLEADFLKEQP